MNTGQMLLTIGAMILLATIMLRVNTSTLQTMTSTYNSKYDILAASIANSIIEEAKDKKFDEATVSSAVSSTYSLTSSGNLKAEYGETYPDFDDFDDYNGYTKIDSTIFPTLFNAVCTVEYITDLNPDVKSLTQTWTKKITVAVSSDATTDTVKLSSLYSYWVFR